MTTLLTYNDIKRMFYTYNYGRSLITFDETYELFEDLDCLNDISKEEFKSLCKSHDVNNDNLIEKFPSIKLLFSFSIISSRNIIAKS